MGQRGVLPYGRGYRMKRGIYYGVLEIEWKRNGSIWLFFCLFISVCRTSVIMKEIKIIFIQTFRLTRNWVYCYYCLHLQLATPPRAREITLSQKSHLKKGGVYRLSLKHVYSPCLTPNITVLFIFSNIQSGFCFNRSRYFKFTRDHMWMCHLRNKKHDLLLLSLLIQKKLRLSLTQRKDDIPEVFLWLSGKWSTTAIN